MIADIGHNATVIIQQAIWATVLAVLSFTGAYVMWKIK